MLAVSCTACLVQASEAAAAHATAEELQRCREALAELAGPALPSTPRECGALLARAAPWS